MKKWLSMFFAVALLAASVTGCSSPAPTTEAPKGSEAPAVGKN